MDKQKLQQSAKFRSAQVYKRLRDIGVDMPFARALAEAYISLTPRKGANVCGNYYALSIKDLQFYLVIYLRRYSEEYSRKKGEKQYEDYTEKEYEENAYELEEMFERRITRLFPLAKRKLEEAGILVKKDKPRRVELLLTFPQ